MDFETEEARLAMLEKTIEAIEPLPLGPTSVKVSWKLVQTSPARRYIEGYRLHFRRRRTDRYESFDSVTIPHVEADSFTIHRLEEYAEYEVFLQPFYKSIVGQTSALKLVRTHQDLPSKAPEIITTKMLNASTAYIAWKGIQSEHQNGPLIGYQVSSIFKLKLSLNCI